MTENERIVIDLATVCGESRGIDAAVAVRDYVTKTLKLSENDNSTKIWYSFDGFCNYWNVPASMRVDKDKKYVNGGFRTRLGATFSHNNNDTKPNENVTQTDAAEKPKVKKYPPSVIVNTDTGTILISVNGITGSVNVPSGTIMLPSVLMTTSSRLFIECASDTEKFLRETVSRCSIWRLGDRFGKGTDSNSAKTDILKSAATDNDWAFLSEYATKEPVEIPCELDKFLSKWLNK